MAIITPEPYNHGMATGYIWRNCAPGDTLMPLTSNDGGPAVGAIQLTLGTTNGALGSAVLTLTKSNWDGDYQPVKDLETGAAISLNTQGQVAEFSTGCIRLKPVLSGAGYVVNVRMGLRG